MYDILNEIWSTAKRNKLRTALTGFAVAWGIFMLIFLLGAGNGLINATSKNSNRFLDNSMMVGGGVTSKAYDGLKEGRRITLDDDDISITERRFLENIDDVGAEITQGGVVITYGENYVSSSLNGVYPNEAEINKIEMLHGRFVNQVDNSQMRKSIVLSENQAKELYRGDISLMVGKNVKVGNIAFRIIGIYKSDQSAMNAEAYTAFNTVRTMYNRGNKADNIVFTFHGLNSIKENEDFEKGYQASLNANHRAAPDDDNATWVWNRFTQNLQMNMAMNIIRTALWVIGIFTLLSGIVGVSNIMLITVKERTREFGIRKAIGATPASILRLIIVESILITTFFGYIGMVLGMVANEYMDATLGHEQIDNGLFQLTMFVNPTVGLDVCVEATLVMIIAGTLAGLIPARKAAHIRPIEALRAE
ncbi:MAG: ABC transporter permease [Prevotella sp.]|nr:ABC transporter permease [Prevotella sp.]MBR6715044.1 ABC transporter permease [Prevotella sp.]